MKNTTTIILLTLTCLLLTECIEKTSTTTTTTTTQNKTSESKLTIIRHIPTQIKAGETFTVTLTLDVNESNKPAVIGVTEYYPSGWKAANISHNGLHKEKNSVIEWLFWAMGEKIEDTNITYQLTTPKTISGDYFFEGNANIGKNTIINTSGDMKATIQNT